MAKPIVGMLLSAAVVADDTEPLDGVVEQQPATVLSNEELLTQPAYAPRWQLIHSGDAVPYSASWQQQKLNLHFQDESALERISRLRSLSILTIAEIGPTRLFFGINHDGLVGLHFNPLPRDDYERDLELVRMPYLENKPPDSEVERMQAESN